MPAGSRFGAFGRFARWAAMRLIHPFVVHQREIDERVLLDIRKVNGGLQEVARRLEVQSATTHAETLAQLRRQKGQIDILSARNETLGTEVKKLTSRLEDLYPHVKSADKLMAESRAVPYVSVNSFESYKNPVWGLVHGYRRNETTRDGRALHTAEDIYREPEPAVRDHQRRYLDLLASSAPVLVASCGRGELLDVLSEQGVDYLGIDPDLDIVEHCRAKGHEHVECADAISYLEGCADESFGAIFCARLLQRLSHEALLRFLALSLRKLRPDGLLVVENLNPHVPVAMKGFLADPAGEYLILPETALALCDISGFASAFVFYPNGSGDVETDRFRENEYALVASKVAQE
jgi:SAM-dependent methyltransferase